MPIRLASHAPDFAERFQAFLAAKRETAADVETAVRGIIADVVARGDRALVDFTRKFDRVDLRRRPRSDCRRLRSTAPRPRPTSARSTRSRSRATASRCSTAASCPRTTASPTRSGVELGSRWTAIEAVGLYVPGGTAAYPSSVLMNAVPAKVAGVPRVVMVVPAPDGKLAPLVLAAAKLAGVDEVYRVGGAQAVAALGLWHRDHQAGRQDRRPGQRLCRGGQAPRLRQGRHRHDRRALRGADPRRPAPAIPTGSPPTCWRRPSMTPARSRSSSPTMPRSPTQSRRRSPPSSRRCRARRSPARRWRDFGAIILVPSLDDAVPLIDAHRPRAS